MKKKITIACVAAAAALACIYGTGYAYYSSHFFPGSTVNGVSISGMTTKEAADTASELTDSYQLSVHGKETDDILSASDFGLTLTLESEDGDIIESALNSQNAAGWLPALISGNNGSTITLQSYYDNEKLAEAVHNLSCITPDEVIETADAYYTYADGQYSVIPEVEGNTADESAVLEAVKESISAGETEVTVTDYYSMPSVTSDDETLNNIVDAANLILSSDITITTAYNSINIDADSIQSFLVIDDAEGSVTIDEDMVYDWVKTNISGPNYTVGSTRTIQTPSSGEITVSGGTYGNWVNVQEETDQIVEELKTGAEVNREPSYWISESSSENGGVGYTYIDVNIAEQTVYLVNDNVVTYSTPCVTGNVSAGNSTPTGTYYVSWKTTNWYMKSFSLTVNYWMPIDDSTGVGLHDATWRSSFGGSIYKTNGSHGCINLSLEAAKYIYNNTEAGIPVIVH